MRHEDQGGYPPQELFPPQLIPAAQREAVSCRCGGLAFIPCAAVFTDKLDVSKREIDPMAFLQCAACRVVFPVSAPAKSKARVDGEDPK